MKVLLVNGSIHADGSTNFALETVAKSLNEEGIETEIFWIGDEPIGGFSATHVYDDNDPVKVFGKKLKDADGFVFGCPVYYASAPGNFISFMDRLFAGNKGPECFRYKPAAAVVSARRGGCSATFDELNKYFLISEMPVIGSTYWNSVHGNNKNETPEDIEGVYTMRNLGKNMAYFLKLIKLGKENGIEPPLNDKVKTNFVR